MKPKPIRAVLFDLDGTLLDTIEDLADSLNHVLAEASLPTHSVEEVRRLVGNGIPKLLERAVSADTPRARIGELYRAFLDYYLTHCRVKTRPYPGIPALLAALRDRGLRLAVVSNKADPATQALIRDFFGPCFDFVLGATEGRELKPDRAMVDAALRALSIQSEEAVYVGDSQVDIRTAENAGMPCVSVTWGFRSRETLLEAGAAILADTPEDVRDWVLAHAGEQPAAGTEGEENP